MRTPSFGLTAFTETSPRAPLAVFGYWLQRRDWFRPWREALVWPMQTRQHAPPDKLQDALVSILAGCERLVEINTKLRPDRVLAWAWGRECFADHSGVSRVLEVLTPDQVEQLRVIHQGWYRTYGQAWQHPAQAGLLRIDLDFTGLPGTRRGEGSEKGYFAGQRNQRGRQIARISAPAYHETLHSRLFPGNTQGRDRLREVIREWEAGWPWPPERRREILWTMDGGFGTDANINWVLGHHYELLTKGYSGKRAAALARQVPEWIEVRPAQRWIARVENPPRYYRKTQSVLRRWKNETGLKHSLLTTTRMHWTPQEVDTNYDQRSPAEGELQADKSGLKLEKRQKQSFTAQETLVLLNDVAHNLVTWWRGWILQDTPLAEWGPQRIVRDLFPIPGRLVFAGPELVRVEFQDTHPYAPVLVECFPRLFAGD